MEIVNTQNAPAAIGPYSQAVKEGGMVFCSGQIAVDEEGRLVEGGIRAQTERVMKNLFAVLEAAGSSSGKVLKTTVYLKNMADFAEMNELYESLFNGHKPARATVEASALPKGALIEMDCVAAV